MTVWPAGEPGWCKHDPNIPHDHHVSGEWRFGDRKNGGEAAIWLKQQPGHTPVVGLLTAQMGSNAIVLGLEDARGLRDALTHVLATATPAGPESP